MYSFGFCWVLLSPVLPGQASAMYLQTHLETLTPFTMFLSLPSRGQGSLNKWKQKIQREQKDFRYHSSGKKLCHLEQTWVIENTGLDQFERQLPHVSPHACPQIK